MSSFSTQLELFESNDGLTILAKEMEAVKKQNEKLKKNLVSKHNELAKFCLQLKEELNEVKTKLENLENKNLSNGNSNSDLLENLFKEAYLGN